MDIDMKILSISENKLKIYKILKNIYSQEFIKDNYIKTTTIILNNTKYLIDDNGLIYSYKGNHNIIGKYENGNVLFYN